MVVSSGFRYYQLLKWQKSNQHYFVGDTVSLTTLDGYYWIRLAKSLDNIMDDKEPDLYRGYPDHPYKLKDEANTLLVHMINILNRYVNNVYYSGIYLVIILSSFFILPVFLYFHSVASTASAIAATLLTTFGYSYFYRTFLGRVDTDCLNLFFPFMISYLIYLTPKTVGFRRYISAVFLGVTGYLYMWWYYYPGLLLIFGVVFLVYLILKRVPLYQIVLLLSLYVVFANPVHFLKSLDNIIYFVYGSKYLAGKVMHDLIPWPNMADFISETQKLDWETILLYSAGNTYIGLLGFVGLGILILRAKVDIIPSLPILLLGLLSFKSGNRFTMYLSPFIYAGLGYLFFTLIKHITYNILMLFDHYAMIFSKTVSVILILLCSVVIISFFSGIKYEPKPSIPVDIQRTMLDLKGRFGELPVAWTWWDFGYAYQDLSGFATVHDGGIQGKGRAYFTACGLASNNQKVLRNIISYFDNKGFMFLEKGGLDIDRVVMEAKSYDAPLKKKNVLVVMSYDMVYKYDGIDFFAKWDFHRRNSIYSDYELIDCYYFNDSIKCNQENVDLKNGYYGDEQISSIYILNENGLEKSYEFSNEGKIIQIVRKGNTTFYSYMLPKDVFETNFNQMFFFGKYDDKYFEKVYDNFPIMRIYRVK
ncbi:MAG: hypothetical protein N3C60_05140 [Calditerrivibrio sp.]|nr:hypothetical protein [Calditerrivibrio sp.]